MLTKVKILLFAWAFMLFSVTAFANSPGGSVLPNPGDKVSLNDCRVILNFIDFPDNETKIKNDLFVERKTINSIPGVDSVKGLTDEVFLGCGIKTGDIPLWFVPFYVRYFLEFVIGLSGLVAVCGVIYGGYLYLFAGLSDDKDQGKKAIMYGVAGFIMTLVAWAIVNIVMSLLTA